MLFGLWTSGGEGNHVLVEEAKIPPQKGLLGFILAMPRLASILKLIHQEAEAMWPLATSLL